MSPSRPAAPKRHVFTSESVAEGHPDKVADQISDAILDELLARDPGSRVACETLLTTGVAIVAGEISTEAYVEIPDVVRAVVARIGYTDARFGFDARTCAVMTAIGRQSSDIARGVDTDGLREQGAGDQGMMFGYATRETDELMPLPIQLAHRLTERLAAVRKGLGNLARLEWLRPDAKSQVSVVYEGARPVSVSTVVVSTQHEELLHGRALGNDEIHEGVLEQVIRPVLAEYAAHLDTSGARFLVNPTGRFVIGGPQGDAGLTGRKIIVDTYGGMARHGGGAFSGKDPSKVDRSAAYAARWVAKHVVAAELAERCEVQLAYAIGVAEPVSVMVETFGTGQVPDERLEEAVRQVFDLRPAGIIRDLRLIQPIYGATAVYGHFGRHPVGEVFQSVDSRLEPIPVEQFTWERTDRTADLRRAAGG